MIATKTKKNIDSMTYESMLRLWRHAPPAHPYFIGGVGDYFSKVMGDKKEKLGQEGAVKASKNIGW